LRNAESVRDVPQFLLTLKTGTEFGYRKKDAIRPSAGAASYLASNYIRHISEKSIAAAYHIVTDFFGENGEPLG
jgi:hypothetical protein